MAPKKKRPHSPDRDGIFHGMVVFLVSKGIQLRRLQVWKQKLEQMSATIEDQLSERVTHIFAADLNVLFQQVNREHLKHFKGSFLSYQWLENCLKLGERLPEDQYILKPESDDAKYSGDKLQCPKRNRVSSEGSKAARAEGGADNEKMDKLGDPARPEDQSTYSKELNENDCFGYSPSSEVLEGADASQLLSLYNPPNLNKNITEIFDKLINIFRALGDDRRSFSYYKAISVVEKLPFKIENVHQVKDLPAIGKSMQDHIHEIVTSGRLSKLEHFEKDEKVRSVTLFGEVWGIGPATALKLYEKGHRTLDDLKNEDSLTSSQRIGLKYFDDIKKKIPRSEVKDMEMLLQKVGQDILPGVDIVCGGSYRRGKASCGDLDIIITHPDGESHKGFLSKYVQYLKDIKFLREDLVFSIHSIEGTDSGVDTYFGLCTNLGQEQRHRIDFKVYPRKIYAFGLIAWTGNDVLNRRLRILADSKGYRLDDTGLFLATPCTSGKQGMKSSTSLSFQTEKEVFNFLGFLWLEPHDRNL